MKKQILMALTGLCLCVSLAACNSSGNSNQPDTNQSGAENTDVKTLDYPNKNVDFIIPYAAGGGTDTLMRLLVANLESDWGKSVVPANKGGNLGQLGLTELSKKKNDGYTIGALSNLDHILVLLTGENLEYSYDDFEYLGAINTTANVLIASEQSGFQSLEEFIEYAKANPGAVTVAISGKTHIAEAGLLETAAGIKVTCVMHGGGGESLNALLGGHVDAAIMDKKFVDQVSGQNCPTLASFFGERLDTIADIPTFRELGYDVSTETYRVIVAPKDTPKEIQNFITESMRRVSDTDEFKGKMTEMSEIYRFLDADEVKARLDEDYASMEKLLEENPDLFND